MSANELESPRPIFRAPSPRYTDLEEFGKDFKSGIPTLLPNPVKIQDTRARIGSRVTLTGLSESEFNGESGTIINQSTKMDRFTFLTTHRWVVGLDSDTLPLGATLLVKPENVRHEIALFCPLERAKRDGTLTPSIPSKGPCSVPGEGSLSISHMVCACVCVCLCECMCDF